MLAIGPVWGSAIQVHRDEVLAIYDPIVTQVSDCYWRFFYINDRLWWIW